jgi:hypothetical protein
MKVRDPAVAAVLAWIAGECWAAPWNAVLSPVAHWGTLLVAFSIVFALGVRGSTRHAGIDLSLITIGATLVASWLWRLWMWHGWFSWDWLGWFVQVTGSDGEGAYRMVEYQFFLLVFAAVFAVWLPYSRIHGRGSNAR